MKLCFLFSLALAGAKSTAAKHVLKEQCHDLHAELTACLRNDADACMACLEPGPPIDKTDVDERWAALTNEAAALCTADGKPCAKCAFELKDYTSCALHAADAAGMAHKKSTVLRGKPDAADSLTLNLETDANTAPEAAPLEVEGASTTWCPRRSSYINKEMVFESDLTSGDLWWSKSYALDVDAGKCYAGRRVQLWEIQSGNMNQRWKFLGDGRIASVKCPGLYLEYEGSRGGKIVLGNGSKNPGWHFVCYTYFAFLGAFTLEYIQNKYGKVVDVAGADARNGQDIYLYTKHGGDNQLWEVDVTLGS